MNGDNVFAGSVEPAVATTTGVIETDEAGRVTGIVFEPFNCGRSKHGVSLFDPILASVRGPSDVRPNVVHHS
ncbi:hypothetical protein SAMN04488066_104150 [Halorubrum aquaticum]|uniref:Uncharacterized protein n=1 Tax=Halorubrum aquaticum TaxID=387340 RepID=A0A1I3A5F3_9EURY|nr:hypothetical protein SAMN04488066_104150 [Halorubrum aquaticum]